MYELGSIAAFEKLGLSVNRINQVISKARIKGSPADVAKRLFQSRTQHALPGMGKSMQEIKKSVHLKKRLAAVTVLDKRISKDPKVMKHLATPKGQKMVKDVTAHLVKKMMDDVMKHVPK